MKLLFGSRDIGKCTFVEIAVIRSPRMIILYVMSNGGYLVVDFDITWVYVLLLIYLPSEFHVTVRDWPEKLLRRDDGVWQ